MLLVLERVVDGESLAELRALLDESTWSDGAVTAQGAALAVKRNLQLARDAPARVRGAELLLTALRAHPLFELAAQPRRISTPLFNRHDAGMAYGRHLDAPFIGADGVRTDIAVTVFLSGPDEYEGGELVIETDYGEQRHRAAAGTAVLYPATLFHRVEEVRRGVRLAGVVWIESAVRDPARRQLLYDLQCATNYFEVVGATQPYVDRLRRTQASLLRMWNDR